ncbi:hypothetical protein EI94DRAFT_192962 [Lactarius quietus]|nr:hypothetical protein EI94DRAFT_192962 [Lactarius quietus]
MEPTSRTTREQRGGMRDDNTSTGGQWDEPMSKGNQGKWEQRGDNTGGRGGDTQQYSGQGGTDLGSNTFGGAGQTGTGLGGTDTSGQYGDQDRFTTGQTAGYQDPSSTTIPGAGSGRQTEDDDNYGAAVGAGGGPTGKPSMTSRVKGAAEQMSDKIMGDSGKQTRGREREGNY